jgi:hypothetical protein
MPEVRVRNTRARRFIALSVGLTVLVAGGLAPKAHASDQVFVGVCPMTFTLSPAPSLVGGAAVSLSAAGSCFIDGVTPYPASISPTLLTPGPAGFGCLLGEATGTATFQVNIGLGWRVDANLRVVSAGGSYAVQADAALPHFLGVGDFTPVACGATSLIGVFVFEDPATTLQTVAQ